MSGEIVETPHEWHDGTVVYQRPCPDCDRGLIWSPARFCGRCQGSGFRLRHTDESWATP